jgi:hypothetical protein
MAPDTRALVAAWGFVGATLLAMILSDAARLAQLLAALAIFAMIGISLRRNLRKGRELRAALPREPSRLQTILGTIVGVLIGVASFLLIGFLLFLLSRFI